jgi:hypothetical protein
MRLARIPLFALAGCAFLSACVLLAAAPPPDKPPLVEGPKFFVDPYRGDDGKEGTETAPWKTVAHALGRLKAGDTLYLRDGVYHERLTVSLQGRAGSPITIRTFPGEKPIIDGGLREFRDKPAECWEPFAGGGKSEFRSRKAYPNLRTVVGRFALTNIGLQTYYHAQDLRADNELWDLQDPSRPKETDVKPLWCGPGLWYDAVTGHFHCRLAHTHLPAGANYQGETDPRKVPLLLASYRALPLHLDGARHVRFQDLIIRGGGYDTVVIDQSSDLEFDNVSIMAGSYGMRLTGAQRLKLHRCGFYGSVPPWTFRTDTSLRSYPGRPHRDITRLGTHALLVPEAGREFSVYALPLNDDWEIAHCEFTAAHDGLYLGGVNVRFHHNKVHDLQDDGIYLSPMYTRLAKPGAEIHLYQNHISKCLTALAFGGPELLNRDQVFIYRNVIDLTEPVQTGRPSSANPKGGQSFGKVMGDHGSPPWSAMKIYHNTLLMAGASRTADMSLTGAAYPDRPRFFLNNILIHQAGLPALKPLEADKGQSDGNLYWSPAVDAKKASGFFAKYRASPAFAQTRKAYAPGFEANSLVADPKLRAKSDYRLQPESPAVDGGVELPASWPDPWRQGDKRRPDIGALPEGVENLATGPGR